MPLLPQPSSLLLLLLPLLLWGGFAARAQAETLTWDASSTTVLNPIVPRWNTQAFFPISLSGNTLTINPGQTLTGMAFGGVSQNADVSSNHTLVNPGANADTIFGGFSETGNVNDIHTVMVGGTVRGLYAGGTAFRWNMTSPSSPRPIRCILQWARCPRPPVPTRPGHSRP